MKAPRPSGNGPPIVRLPPFLEITVIVNKETYQPIRTSMCYCSQTQRFIAKATPLSFARVLSRKYETLKSFRGELLFKRFLTNLLEARLTPKMVNLFAEGVHYSLLQNYPLESLMIRKQSKYLQISMTLKTSILLDYVAQEYFE